MDVSPILFVLQTLLLRVRVIRAVGPHILLLTVVNAGTRHRVAVDDFVGAIKIRVCLVAIKGNLVFLRPFRIDSVVGLLVVTPVFGGLACCLAVGVVLTAVALARHFNKSGVDHLSTAGLEPLRVQHAVKLREQLFKRARLASRLTEQPQRSRVWNIILKSKTWNMQGTLPIQTLVLGFCVRRVV